MAKMAILQPVNCRLLPGPRAAGPWMQPSRRLGLVDLLAGESGGRGVAAYDRHALVVRQHGVDVGETVGSKRLDRIDDALRSAFAVHANELRRERQPLLFIGP